MNYASTVLWTAVTLLTVGLRESTYRLGDRSIVEAMPYLVPTTSFQYLTRIGDSPYATNAPPLVILRATLIWIALVISFAPSADDPPLPPPQTDEDGEPPAPHILDKPGYAAWIASRGAVFTLAFWDEPELDQTPPMAPDGGPPLPPIPRNALSRRVFTNRVFIITFCIAVDASLNACSESILWYKSWLGNLFGDYETTVPSRMFPELFLGGLLLIERSLILWHLFYMVTETALFRVGLLRTVSRKFKGIFPLQLLSVLLPLALTILRVVAIVSLDGSIYPGGGTVGQLYTALLVLHLFATILFYILTIDAMRRLARSELYIDPQRLLQLRVNRGGERG